MKGPTSAVRFSEAQKLLDYGFNTFEYKELSKKGDFFNSINVSKGISSKVNTGFENDTGLLVKKGESGNIDAKVSIPHTISAPVKLNQKIGEVEYYIGDKKIATTNIVAQNDVKNLNFGNMTAKVLENWFTLFR